MTDSDELLAKADALLARWRSGTAVPRLLADYPVLTDVVKAPAARNEMQPPELPSESEMLELDASPAAAQASSPMEVPVLDSPEVPAIDAAFAPAATDGVPAMIEASDELPNL